ncbi:MAG: hypothetical protein IKO06_02470 [Alphaproteobacteria bacterium]|nr:hypothetical protein [Alphaproteobacteria bacterium]
MRNLEIKNQNGRSMIEMLGVLAIIGVLSVGGIAGYSKAMMKYRINKTIEQITLIAGNVRTFFAPQKSYEGVNKNKILCKAKIIPDEMWYSDTSIINVFGYGVYVENAYKSTSGDNKAFKITYKLPSSEENFCIELLSQDWTDVGIIGIQINAPHTATTNVSNLTVPISIEDAVTACTKATNAIITAGSSSLIGTKASMIQVIFYFDVNSNCWSETNGNTCS